MTIAMLRALMDYNHTLYRRLWDSIALLTEEQFARDVVYSRGSVRSQMLHVANAEGRWLRGLREVPNARQYRLHPADYPTRESVRAVWEANAHDLATYVDSLSDADLQRVPAGMGGPVWHVLMHLVNHGTDHRAQILRILGDFGAPTFDQDLIYHLWRR